MTHPMRRIWINFSPRLAIRNNGLLKLRSDVRDCEYEDVQVMWEMLQNHEIMEVHPLFERKKKRSVWDFFGWASSCTPNNLSHSQ